MVKVPENNDNFGTALVPLTRYANGMPPMPSKMHSTTRRKSGSFTLKTLSAAVVSALLFSNAHAAGLGKLTVLSSLGQPLRAEIELTTESRDEAGALIAKLASAEAFRQANIDFNSALNTLHFSVEQRGERQFIRVTSAQPLNEPFVDMLLELSGPNGRLVREYTFLLDPPDLRSTQTAQVAPVPTPASEPSAVKAPQSAAESVPALQPGPLEKPADVKKTRQAAVSKPVKLVPQSASEAKDEAQPGGYKVKSGDSLGKIAGQLRKSGVSLDQMLVALHQANPNAFVGNNMNRLKAGQILSLPSTDTVRSINRSEAHSIVLAQSVDFNNYRAQLAGQTAAAAPQKSAESKQSAGGKIAAKVEEKSTPAAEAKDKLKLSNTMSASGATADKSAAGSAEDKIAKEKAAAEANARVKELEKNVSDLQKVLEIKNKSLAEQQKQADAVKAEAKPVAPAASAPAASAPTVSTPATEAIKPAVPVAPTSKASAPAPVKPKPAAPPAEPSMIDALMDNPLVLPGLGALLVALGGLGIYSARRKKSKQFEDSIISDSSLKANSLFGSTGGQSVDTNNSVFNSSFTPSVSQLDTNEVDPVAEADVYIAYGRDAQAEEILKEALRTQPERHAVRVKLLEIYSNRKDLRAFEVMATELYGLTKGEGDEWAQAAVMGAVIDANNPLYAGSKETKQTGAMMAPTQPLEDQGLATLLSTTQAGTSIDEISSLETDTSYFSNTAMATEKPLEPVSEAMPEPEQPQTKASSNEIDFNLDGLSTEVPNTTVPPASAEPPAELASIDFNFLDEPAALKVEPAAEAAYESMQEPEPKSESDMELGGIPPIADLDFNMKEEIAAKDAPLEIPAQESGSLELNIPELPETAEIKAEPAAEAASMDFDLSDINLDLGQEQAKLEAEPELHVDLPVLDLNTTSVDAEMATKLDLAIAYQEIGDREGARELLDEVLKGGTPEQSERAKSLLMELA